MKTLGVYSLPCECGQVYIYYIIRDAVGIELQPNNMNREDGFCLSKSCIPRICSLKDFRKTPSQDSRGGFSTGLCRSLHAAFISARP
jgi:hypothetical protein